MAEEKKETKTLKIKFARQWCSELGTFAPGTVAELDAAIAKSLVKEGMGELA